ncbi:salicylate synthase [Nocardia sp. IBHARD005]|uniref:salicylate synthase n=1 Tax=Nocardia sp. IBHARD005 TaxID=3457765 RepID=UPI00405907B8
MTRLAAAVELDEYVVYERPPVWTFAAGAVAEVVVTQSHSTLRIDGFERAVARDRRTLAELPALLAQVPLTDWRAYGMAMFEMSYGDTESAADERATLMKLIVPRVEVVVDGGEAIVRGVDDREVAQLAALIAEPVPDSSPRCDPVDVEFEASGADFRAAVADVLQEIKARGLQKVVLSRDVPIDGDVDVPATFRLGRANNTPARSFLLHLDGVRAAGFSPEIIAEVSAEGRVHTQPLAGTRAVSTGASTGADLLDDPKEVFEHAIAVRNSCHDMATVCRPESIAVTDYMAVQRRGTVQHIGSMVSGELAAEQTCWDAFMALFPTLIGRPRPEAFELIGKFESSPRGPYGGAVLAIDSAGNLDATLTIRALFQQSDGRTWLRAGVGLVPQSTPDREFEETCEKMRSVASYVVRPAVVDA